MLIEASEKFILKRAFRGDNIAMCEIIDKSSDREDWTLTCSIMEHLVENEPMECEMLILQVTKCELLYEDMLRMIGWNYYHTLGNIPIAYKWFQKYFDYLDFKYVSINEKEREKIKDECGMYQLMKKNGTLYNNATRFWLKWERDYFLNSAR